MTDLATPDIRPQVPLARPDIGALEEELVLRALRSGTLALGPFAEELEREVARLAGRRHGVAVSSGTAGLHMAMAALEIGPGDEVITTPFSFVASANCILYQGANPRFVDIEEETLGLDPAAVEAELTPATRALLPVDVFGHP
jgi:perosamine synthetase